ncbi:unnamed protein product [Prunus brigantina]
MYMRHKCSLLRRANQMSNLIRSRKAVSAAQSSPPPSQPLAATAPAEMDHLPIGPRVFDAPVSSTSSVAQLVSAKRRHRPPSTSDTISTDASAGSGSQPVEYFLLGQGPCRQLKTAKTNYNLEDLDDESLAYVNRLFGERYKQWKSDLYPHFQAFDDPQVAIQEGCPKELEGREDSCAWLCAHFLAPEYVNKATVNKGNRKKKTLLHHSGSRPFSYRMDARRRGGSKFPEIDVFGDVYVRPGNELAESIHVNDDGGEEPVGSSGVCLPTSSRYSAQVCASSTGCGISDLDGDIGSDSREEARDILSRDGECPVAGTYTPFIVAVKRGYCFDSDGGRA